MSDTTKTQEPEFGCETCPIRRRAEKHPRGLVARFWRWHTTWCPGWKEYQEHLAKQAAASPPA